MIDCEYIQSHSDYRTIAAGMNDIPGGIPLRIQVASHCHRTVRVKTVLTVPREERAHPAVLWSANRSEIGICDIVGCHQDCSSGSDVDFMEIDV